jgi:hypothetical protein
MSATRAETPTRCSVLFASMRYIRSISIKRTAQLHSNVHNHVVRCLKKWRINKLHANRNVMTYRQSRPPREGQFLVVQHVLKRSIRHEFRHYEPCAGLRRAKAKDLKQARAVDA